MKLLYFFVFIFNILHRTAGADGGGGIGKRVTAAQTGSRECRHIKSTVGDIKSTQKRLKLGMVSSFDPKSMSAKVESITTKTGCTSCTNWTISFKVQGF